MYIKVKGNDGFEYGYCSSPLSADDWVFNVNKGEHQHIGTVEEARKLNALNDEFGAFLFPIYCTDNPELIAQGVTEDLSDDVWYSRLTEDKKQNLVHKYGHEMTGMEFTLDYRLRIKHMRMRDLGVITDKMVARTNEIKNAASAFARVGGMMAYVSEDRLKGFIAGAEWSDKGHTNPMSREDLFELCLDSMNMVLTQCQDQLSGNGGDKSDKELLTDWFNEKFPL